MLKNMLKLIRPKQWVKNIFVLVPLIFSKTFTDPMSVIKALAALFCFVLASSSVYILNDIIDIEKTSSTKQNVSGLLQQEMSQRGLQRFSWWCFLY